MTRAQALREPATQLPPQLSQLLEEHGPFVRWSLRDLGVREAELDDTLQEVFLVVYQRSSDAERQRRARAWLYSICTRVAQAQRRKYAAAALRPFEGASAPTQFAHVEDREALALVHRLLSQIPAREREVFLLYELEDRSMSQIAQALQCPLQTAYSRLYKARSRILAKLDRLAGEK